MGKLIDLIKGWFSIRDDRPLELIPEHEIYDVAKDEDIRKRIVSEINTELEKRMMVNQPWNMQWILNLNFIRNNQYCDIMPIINDVIQTVRQFDYQERKTYNMIASIIETRIALLNMVDYTMKARPVTNDRDDTIRASLNTKILKAHCRNQKLPALMRSTNAWSESCGTGFLMPVWNPKLGKYLGEMMKDDTVEPLYMGDIETMICSPFEILPDDPYHENVEDCRSIIRYKVYHVDEVEEIWGVAVKGGNVNILTSQFKDALVPSQTYDGTNTAFSRVDVDDSVVVAELWERPSRYYRNGRLVIIAGDTLVYYGALPFKNGRYGKRCIPLISVKSIDVSGCFWGKSIVERLIPVQQEYNALRNRKTELLNLISNMPLAVEQGSVDIEALKDEGIAPGSIIEYRRGSQAPKFLEAPDLPQSLIEEERNLINLFTLISGVSEMSWRSQIPASATSGAMLQIVQELDNTRLSIAAKNGRQAVLKLAEMWMALSKEYVGVQRVEAIAGDTDSYETVYWDGKDIEYYDLEYETENELAQTPAQRYQMIMDFAKMGLFVNPKTGQMDEISRAQLLSKLEVGDWESIAIRAEQQKAKARRNIELIKQGQLKEVTISSVDDNAIQIDEYTGFMLSNEYRKLAEENTVIGEFMEGFIGAHYQEIQRKAQEEMMGQINMQIQGQQAQALAQMQFQNVAAAQTATMQSKYANQATANSQTVPQPGAPEQPEGMQNQELPAAQQMAQLLAQVE